MISLLAIALLGIGSNLASTQEVRLVHAGLSPFMSDRDRGVVSNQVLNLVGTAPAETRLIFEDGWNLQTIATFEIPALKSDRPGVRARFLKRPLWQLLTWFQRVAEDAAVPSDLRGTSALRIPEYLAFASQQPATEPRSILLIGPPLYQSLNEPGFSFGQDRFPSDAALFCEPAGSIFSVLGKRERLKKTQVFFLYPNEGLFRSELYKDHVARFWNLFTEYQGGVMAGFHADAERTFAMLTRSGLPPVRRDGVDPAMTKVEMLSITREIPWRTITNQVGEVKFVFEQPRTPERAEESVIRELEQAADNQTVIGIMWSIPGLDLDLYVWHHPEAAPLFFRNTSTSEGRYIHDYVDQNAAVGDYEKVILDAPSDLNRLRAFVNFFAGQSAAPVEGKVFLRHRGQTLHGTFELAARSGNQGNDLANRSSSPFWTELKLTNLSAVSPAAHANR